jgi:hypothetical protein
MNSVVGCRSFAGWHALRYSEGRGRTASTFTPFEDSGRATRATHSSQFLRLCTEPRRGVRK